MELHRIENFFDEIELVGNSNGFELKAKDIEWWNKEDADEDEGIIIMRDLEDETFEEVLSRDSDSMLWSVATMWGNVSEESDVVAKFKDVTAATARSIDSEDFFDSFVTVEEYFNFYFTSNEIQEVASERDEDSDKENKVVNDGGRVWGLKLFEEFEQNVLRSGAASLCKDINSNYEIEDRDSCRTKDISKPENGKNKKQVATNKRTRLAENKSDGNKVDAKRVRQSERINTRKVAEKKRPLMEISNTLANSQMVSKKAKLENSRTVQIVGLHPEETESSILERYKAFGKVLKTNLSVSSQGKMVGFVTFSNAKSATKCLKNGNCNTNLLQYDMRIIK